LAALLSPLGGVGGGLASPNPSQGGGFEGNIVNILEKIQKEKETIINYQLPIINDNWSLITDHCSLLIALVMLQCGD